MVRAWDVHTLMDTQLPPLVQLVHLTFVHICTERERETHAHMCATHTSHMIRHVAFIKLQGSRERQREGKGKSEDLKKRSDAYGNMLCTDVKFWS